MSSTALRQGPEIAMRKQTLPLKFLSERREARPSFIGYKKPMAESRYPAAQLGALLPVEKKE